MNASIRTAKREPFGTQPGAKEFDFNTHFRAHIEPHFNALERQRLSLKRRYTWRLVAASGFLFCLLTGTVVVRLMNRPADGVHELGFFFWFSAFMDMAVVGAFFGIIPFLWAQGPRKQFARRYKERLLPAVAKFFGDFFYDAKGGIDLDQLIKSKLLASDKKKIFDYRHEDMFTGTYRGVGVAFCEVNITIGSNRAIYGAFVVLTMNKTFRGETIVRHDLGTVGNALCAYPRSTLKPVKLEDPRFEKLFQAYSNDQIEARYLLTPAFMTRLMDLSKTVGADSLELSFIDSQLMIMLPRRGVSGRPAFSLGRLSLRLPMGPNLFEPGSIYKSLHEADEVNRIFDEFKAILSIVDILKLHERTGF